MADTRAWAHLKAVTRPALILAPRDYLADIRVGLAEEGIQDAVTRHDTGRIFDWLIGIAQFQGISDANAVAYMIKHGVADWHEIRPALDSNPPCHRLRSYWDYSKCSYRKAQGSCAEPGLFQVCSLPKHPARKGDLIQGAYSLALFIRDVCGDDFVRWIDQGVDAADPGCKAPDRGERMGVALLEPLSNIHGFGPKVVSLALADLLLEGAPARERWVTTGAAMTVVDTLVHNFLHRSGVLLRFGAEHSYGAGCYAPGGCADIVRGLAARIDAREFNPSFPAYFPRLIQHALWRFCSEAGLNICNGNRIDDRGSCQSTMCPAFPVCDRVPLKGNPPAASHKVGSVELTPL